MMEPMEEEDHFFPDDPSKFELHADEVLKKIQEPASRVHLHQIKAVLKTKALLERDPPGVVEPALIVSPTGSGKSGMIALLPYALKARRVLIITPSVKISEQIGVALGKKKDKSFLEVAKLYTSRTVNRVQEQVRVIEGRIDLEEKYGNLVILNAHKFGTRSGTALKLIRGRNEEVVANVVKFFEDYDLLIIDEAHHFPAETWKLIVETFKSSAVEPGTRKKLVFLTATPNRKIGNTTQFILGEEPQKEDRIAFSITADELKGNTIRSLRFEEKANKKNLAADFQVLLFQQTTAEPRYFHQAIVIVKTMKEADQLAENLQKKFPRPNFSVAIHGGKGRKSKQLTEAFTKGEYQVAVICGLLKEGYDNPNVSVCVIHRPIRSRLLFAQFVGRCTRLNRSVGGASPDKADGQILAYKEFEQRALWEEMEWVAEQDPLEED